ncbi:flagellar hook protein FlgE [Crenobacter intestini]|uniref:Flagellar hook protein FlgE n=1 Tax=Crenobacter intestini TaxID=2563443 RepID=A0A4T0V248_9NEIS|nr:flagellar hook protein FlgE [Crenobacter intestini]TIC85225.1 flagellar hook-basal body complex protein [Crenobacter intestini]
MSFQQGLSGLGAASKQLDVIGNNVANASTIGFKRSRAEFADLYAASMYGVAATATGIGARTVNVSQQFNQGNINSTGNPFDLAISGQGFFRMEGGDGQAMYTRNGEFQLDRDGYFVNAGHYLTGYGVNDRGEVIVGPPQRLRVDTSNIGAKATTEMILGSNLDARAEPPYSVFKPTGSLAVGQSNLSSTAPTSAVTSQPIQVFDAAGKAQSLQLTYTPTATPGQWTVSGTVGGTAVTLTPATLTFDAAGKLTAPAGGQLALASTAPAVNATVSLNGLTSTSQPTSLAAMTQDGSPTTGKPFPVGIAGTPDPDTYNYTNTVTAYDSLGVSHQVSYYYVKQEGAPNTWKVFSRVDGGAPEAMNPDLVFDTSGKVQSPMQPYTLNHLLDNGAANLSISIDLSGFTQNAGPYANAEQRVDGWADGVLSSVSTSKEGYVEARYSNGQTKIIGQVVLANFANAQGLQPIGDNRWAETYASGGPKLNAPGSSNVGLIQGAALEESNVDMTTELVNMITAQRFYQANAQTIKTQDTVLQTLINIR